MKIVDKYNIADENIKRCLTELEDKLNSLTPGTSNSGTVKYFDRTVTEKDLTGMNKGDIIIEEPNSRIVTKINGKLRTATLTDL